MRPRIGTGRNCDICSIFLDVYVYDDEGKLSIEYGEPSHCWTGGLVRLSYIDLDKQNMVFKVEKVIYPSFVCQYCYKKYHRRHDG